jgi:hypothetical protein
MPIMRKLVKLAVGFAVAKALARHGGPKGLLDSVLSSAGGRGDHDHRTNRGPDRTPRQKRGDAHRRPD